jgi:hypothetical protein
MESEEQNVSRPFIELLAIAKISPSLNMTVVCLGEDMSGLTAVCLSLIIICLVEDVLGFTVASIFILAYVAGRGAVITRRYGFWKRTSYARVPLFFLML